MDNFLDVYTLVMLGIALVLIWKLRSVLGTRTGHERPPYNPYSGNTPPTKHEPRAKTPASTGNPVEAGNLSLEREETLPALEHEEARPSIRLSRDQLVNSPQVRETLLAMMEKDPAFDPSGFLKGASAAYEMIVSAFAKGDTATLRPLLARDVFENFSKVIRAREEAKEVAETSLIGFERAQITDARIEKGAGLITVAFSVKLISLLRDHEGRVIEGDPNEVVDVDDVWTFRRELASRDPNWLLLETHAQD